MKRPIMLPEDQIDLMELRRAFEVYFDMLEDPEIEEVDDDEHEIFEQALTAFFGPDVWNWVNKKLI